jgi:uncharacterized protein (DUF983 family)
MKSFNPFLKANFNCDKCGKEFTEATAYSLANN